MLLEGLILPRAEDDLPDLGADEGADAVVEPRLGHDLVVGQLGILDAVVLDLRDVEARGGGDEHLHGLGVDAQVHDVELVGAFHHLGPPEQAVLGSVQSDGIHLVGQHGDHVLHLALGLLGQVHQVGVDEIGVLLDESPLQVLHVVDLAVLGEGLDEDLAPRVPRELPLGGVEARLLAELDLAVGGEVQNLAIRRHEIGVLLAALGLEEVALGVAVVAEPYGVGVERPGDGQDVRPVDRAVGHDQGVGPLLGLGKNDLRDVRGVVVPLARRLVLVALDADVPEERNVRLLEHERTDLAEETAGSLSDRAENGGELNGSERTDDVGRHVLLPLFVSPLTEVRTVMGSEMDPKLSCFAFLKKIGGADYRHTNRDFTYLEYEMQVLFLE